ncbi:hypothetical protein W97_08570 [Coniosporium apollinis CBS 100218]|uniref:Uncharacterized protein n=1 Tax=Coniosporium apollinis (strain CBS 100218) TaxID=1168221 RepID=R7Z539_CONA1|nr:uncharacterized protein W97_08570 [Coniosporium apollinis CBS 100218]EON69310.1 hypothetical protein W97_08570 [Coniosporium apollinis CBS 100218]
MLSQRTPLLRPAVWRYLNPHRISAPSPALRSATAPQTASFSTTPYNPLQKDSLRKPAADETPTYPAFSMEGLGASRTVKIVIYTAITIIGTIETYAYGKWAWYKLYPPPKKEEGGGDAATS